VNVVGKKKTEIKESLCDQGNKEKNKIIALKSRNFSDKELQLGCIGGNIFPHPRIQSMIIAWHLTSNCYLLIYFHCYCVVYGHKTEIIPLL